MRVALVVLSAVVLTNCGARHCDDGLTCGSDAVDAGADWDAPDLATEADSPEPAEADTSTADAPNEVAVADALPDITIDEAVPSKTVFVTKLTYWGALGGLDGADGACQSSATKAHLTGAFRAWLSDNTTSAASRLAHSTLAYRLPDGTIVAANWAELSGGRLRHAIDETETGTLAAPTLTCWAWTATAPNGSQVGGTCENWTSFSSQVDARGGKTASSEADWTDGCDGSCLTHRALYCVEQ